MSETTDPLLSQAERVAEACALLDADLKRAFGAVLDVDVISLFDGNPTPIVPVKYHAYARRRLVRAAVRRAVERGMQ